MQSLLVFWSEKPQKSGNNSYEQFARPKLA